MSDNCSVEFSACTDDFHNIAAISKTSIISLFIGTLRFDDITISRLIIQSFSEKLTSLLDVDVAMVGAGPSNLTAGYYLGKAGIKAVILESKLAPGGGLWGGGMMGAMGSVDGEIS